MSPSKKKRQSPRCGKCAHRPVRSQCIHTKAGLAYLAGQRLSRISDGETESSSSTDATPASTTVAEDSVFNETSPTTEDSVFNETSPTTEAARELGRNPYIAALPFMFAPATSVSQHSPISSGVIDPRLLLLPPSSPPSMSPASSPCPPRIASQLVAAPTSPAVGDDYDDDSGSSSSNRATRANPIHGFVKNAGRGNSKLEIVRPRGMRPKINESSKASKRFNVVAKETMARLESLANETGSWIYFAAQHTTASEDFVHYISPRLNREGLPQLAAVHQQMGQLLAALLSSRRANATELEIRLAASEAAAREHQRVIERLTSMLATKEQRIEKLGSFMEQHSSTDSTDSIMDEDMQVATHTLYGRPLRNLADVDQAVKDAYDNTCGMPNCTRPLCMDLPSINVWAYRSFQNHHPAEKRSPISPIEWRGRAIGRSFVVAMDKPFSHLLHVPATSYMYWNVAISAWKPLGQWESYDSSIYPLFILRPRGYPDFLCLGISALIRQLYPDGEAPEEYRVGEQPNGIDAGVHEYDLW